MKGLPLTYNRDLQEDKEPVFDATDTVQACLAITARMIPSITVNREAMAGATRDGFLEATDLADYLVQKGMSFRVAHRVVGAIVRECVERDRRLSDLTLAELKAYSSHFRSDAKDLLDPQTLVRKRDNPGGTAPRRVRAALRKARRLL
jgi:argininosuccinate lyase